MTTQIDFLSAAYYGRNDDAIEALRAWADVNETDPATGLSALHLAVGTNNEPLAKALIEEFQAAFFADRRGRWPSSIALDLAKSEEFVSYVWNAEARFLGLPYS